MAHLTAAVLANVKAITEDSVARMDTDAQDVSKFYGRFQKPERVRGAGTVSTVEDGEPASGRKVSSLCCWFCS